MTDPSQASWGSLDTRFDKIHSFPRVNNGSIMFKHVCMTLVVGSLILTGPTLAHWDDHEREEFEDALHEGFHKDMETLIKKKKYDEAYVHLHNAAEATNNPETWKLLANVHGQKGEFEDAIYCYTVVTELDPERKDVAAWLDSVLKGKKRPEIRTIPTLVFNVTLPDMTAPRIFVLEAGKRGPMEEIQTVSRFGIMGPPGAGWTVAIFDLEEDKEFDITVLNISPYHRVEPPPASGERIYKVGRKIVPPDFKIPKDGPPKGVELLWT